MDVYYMRLLITITPSAVTRRPAVPAPGPLGGDRMPTGVDSGAGDAYVQAARRLPEFRSAVLAGFDQDGLPTMTRVRPVIDPRSRSLLITVPEGFSLRPGKASLLCHSHDEQLWHLRSFLVRGVLERSERGWVLRPTALVPGTGMAGALGDARAFLAARRRAGRYLARRGLPRPVVAWDSLRGLRRAGDEQARHAGGSSR